ncbi:unnamed protein product [Paramecium pentaurelia]|uniref:Uncharacterized protein n=1 Tax=Paramecium pentaurelia TaxID=43138 RepID=A0A8S1X5Z8_9CILI|nr:unnamed protein product [Paramecium pentaurelia]
MKSLTSKDYITKYTQIFQESLPLCLQYRKDKEWQSIIDLIQDQIQQFEKLPNIIKQKIDQFTRSSLFFFLAEAQYHLKQSLNAEDLLLIDSKDQKINQIKAKTYYMLYKQSNKIEHIEQAFNLANEYFGPDHKITQLYQSEHNERQRKIKFQQLQSIPNFDIFKQGLEFQYYNHKNKKVTNKTKGKTIHLSEIEKLTTQESTFEPSKKVIQKFNESSFRISDKKINLFVPLQNSNFNTKSNIQFRLNTNNSELKGSLKVDSLIDNQISGTMTELLLPRPLTGRQKHSKKIMKTQPTPTKHHHQQQSNSSQQQLNRGNILKKSQVKMHQVNLVKSNSKQKIEIKESLNLKIFDSKSIQCEISEDDSVSIYDQNKGQKEFEFNFSPRVGQSYYSLNTSNERSRHQIDFEYLRNRIDCLYDIQQEDALRMIIKNFRNFVQKQKAQKKEELMKKSVAKQNFSNLIFELGATKNIQIEEKIAKIKSILHICQVIDQGSLKTWMIFSPIKQINAINWKIRNISWIVFKRLKAKKSQIHPDIIKLYKEYPKYHQIIEIWSNSIDGTNAIFVLTIQIEVLNRLYDIRLHLKNIHNIAKDFENIFSSIEMVSQLIHVYFSSHGIHYNQSIRSTTQCILTKQTILRQDMLKKGCQSISNHINQLFMSNFLNMKTENGSKFRRVTLSEQILENQVALYQQIEERRKIIKKTFTPFQIGNGYISLKNSKVRNQKLMKSLSIAIELHSPVLKLKGASPKNYWADLRSQSFKVGFQDKVIEEEDLTPKSGESVIISPKTPITPPTRKKNNAFSSTMSYKVLKNSKSKKKLIDDYFKNYPKQRDIIQKKDIPMNPYQSQQNLLSYLSKNEDGWTINNLTFTFNFENPQQFGHFIITQHKVGQSENVSTILSLIQFCQLININEIIIKNHLGYFRSLPYIAKLTFLQQLHHQEIQNKNNSKYTNNDYNFPEYRFTKKLQRKSLVTDSNQINKDHFYIFFYKPPNQFRVLFRIKQSIYQRNDIFELFVYKISQPRFIRILNQSSLTKLQDLFRKIIHQQSRPTIGSFQQIQRVLNYYLLKDYKANGRCWQIGFQNSQQQIFNYELKSCLITDVYIVILKHLVANEQSYIKNLLRTYCKVTKFQLVSKLDNFTGINLIYFTEYAMAQNLIILEIQIYPFEKRLSSYKTYLNHNDLKNFGIQYQNLEEKALLLKNKLSLCYNRNQQQVHLSVNSEFNYVSQLNENLKADYTANLFIKQKQVIKLIFQKVKKFNSHFLIFSLFYNTFNNEILIQIYIPKLCKLFRSVLSQYDFNNLHLSKLEKIIPGNILDNFDQCFNQIPQRYNSFVTYMKEKECINVDEQFSIKSRFSERSAVSSISLQKYKDQYEKLQQNPTQLKQEQTSLKLQTKNLLQSECKKIPSKLHFSKQKNPQRVSHEIQYFKERFSIKPSVTKFDNLYDSGKLQKILEDAVVSTNLIYKYFLCYFWEQMIDECNIIMTNYNKYILQMDSYRGILRQLGVTRRVFIDDDYQAEIFFEQQQVEYGSMFEKYSSVTLKESQSTSIYFSYKQLNASATKTINLKCQFRQCIYNYSKFNQVSYNTALKILKQSSDYITNQIKQKKKLIEFQKLELKSITALRTNKKSINLETYINNHSKYKFIYQCRLMMNVIVTILYKNNRFYFYLEDCKKQVDFLIKMSIKSVQENIPHIFQLLRCQKEFTIGQRLFSAYKNYLIIKAYENLFRINN